MLSIDQLERTPDSKLARTFVAEIADRDPALLVHENEDIAHLLEQPAFARVGRAVVVDGEGGPLGVVSLTDIQRALRAARLHDDSNSARPVPR
jgi:CBS domain containing-hemolysin-like protein